MSNQFKGVIKFISTPRSKWALVREYKSKATNGVNNKYAVVTSTVAPSAATIASAVSTIAPNASEQFIFSPTVNTINIAVDTEGPIDIDVTGDAGITTAVSIDSIIERINASFTGSPASKIGTGISARIKISGTVASYSGVVAVEDGTSNSCLANIFGSAVTVNGKTAECFDLSVNKHVNITVDAVGPTEVKIDGATPASTTVDEIVANINAIFSGRASKVGSGDSARIQIKGIELSSSGVVTVAAGSTTNALTTVFNGTTLTDTGNSGMLYTYETTPSGYRPVRADFTGKAKGDTIEYSYNYGNNITIL